MRSSRRAYSDVAMGPSGLLDHLLVDHLDVLSDAVEIASERILRKPRLVLRRQLIADLALHLCQGGALGRRLLHGGDEIDEVSAEEREMALGPHLAVPGHDGGEVELLEGGQRVDPVFRVTVVHEIGRASCRERVKMWV